MKASVVRRIVARRTLCAAVSMSALAAMPTHAQDAAAPASVSEAATGLGDIVVTARRRNENLHDVPVAITAFTGEALQTRNITEVTALDGLAPNVKVVESSSNVTTYIQIRGSVTTNPNPGYEPAAAMYIDGVYIGKAVGSTVDVADIDHIEVLRGPQGTLFGRNTLAGAVNIVTKKPSGTFGGWAKLGAGDYGRKLGQFSLDLPEFNNISIKLAGLISRRNGFVHVRDNPYPAIPGQDPTVKRIGDERSEAFRAAVRYRPVDNLTLDYTFDYNRVHNTPIAGVLQSIGQGGIFDPNSSNYVGVPLYLYLQNGRTDTSYATGGVDNAKMADRVKTFTHTLTGTLSLGEATLKSITSYRTMKWLQSLDLDGTPLPIAAGGSNLDYHQFSQEIQVTGKLGRLVYTGGLYYFHDKGDNSNPQQFFGTTLESLDTFTTNADAIYAQVDYTPPILDDKLVLTAGYRYSHERKTSDRFASAGGFVTIPAGTISAASFHGSTPTFIAKYSFTPAFNVYAKYAEGFKSGGFSVDATDLVAATTPYAPETVKSIEVGSKLRLFGGRLILNAAAFFDKHDNQQIAIFKAGPNGFVTLTANGAKSKIKGFELEAQAKPVDWLMLSGNVGHTDPRFTQYFGTEGGPNIAKTQAFAFVPRWQATVSGDARLFQADNLQVNVAVDFNYNSKYAALPYSTDPATNPNIYSTLADSQKIVDGRVIFSKIPIGGTTLTTTVFVKNIFNDASRTAGIDFGPSFGNIVTRNYNFPRSFGVDATVRF
ncbi:TonB-dependent receptor [Flavisphingomonas formosensis]|uniref:TonB-dependent receptor n=1 Tax=Flavisphingomonas formosensis TaxID=861534 RepID=UPI0012F95B29|nr:TonB-dependent receptor [Sphingomonas formosensis]